MISWDANGKPILTSLVKEKEEEEVVEEVYTPGPIVQIQPVDCPRGYHAWDRPTQEAWSRCSVCRMCYYDFRLQQQGA